MCVCVCVPVTVGQMVTKPLAFWRETGGGTFSCGIGYFVAFKERGIRAFGVGGGYGI